MAQPDARHAVVELSSTQLPITIKVHTLLDGTAVLTRWLEITNHSAKSMALTGLFPLAGQLWSGSATADVGYATHAECCWEGWFGWQRLTPGTNRIQQEHGLSFDHPYFLLHNETRGDYFFAELEWPLNRVIEFYNHDGVSFKMGPTAANALRVLAPGETVTSPRLHLGHTRGTFDAAVQAMHDHVRRSVLTPRKTGSGIPHRGSDVRRSASNCVPRGAVQPGESRKVYRCRLAIGDGALYSGRPHMVRELWRVA